MTHRFCKCPGCKGCPTASGTHEKLFDWSGGQLRCPACVPGKTTRRAAAPVERLSQPPGGNAMTETVADYFRSMGPGTSRRLSVGEFTGLQRQAVELEARAARADELERNAAEHPLSARARVQEPRTYTPHAKHSFFVDLLRSKYASDQEAKERLARHDTECLEDSQARRSAYLDAATQRLEATFGGDTLDRMSRAGVRPFESRAINRTDGQGGYFTPPVWLVDEYVPPARAGTEFSSMWTRLPLPPGTAELNLPVMSTGTGTGPQGADGAPVPSRDVADTFVNAAVRTIAGQLDASAQWYEQGSGALPAGLDSIIFADLEADAALQLEGECLVGADASGQLRGIWPGGAIGIATAVQMINVNNNATQTWVANGGSGTTLDADLGRLVSGVTRARGKRPTCLISHPWVWEMLTGTVDGSGRPLGSYQPAALGNGDAPDMGILGYWRNGLPWIGSASAPTTFGGSVLPQMAPVTGTQFAAQAGAGAAALYSPILAARPADMYMWQGTPQIRLLREPLAGTMGIRFQLVRYAALIPNRYQALSSGTLPNSSGWSAGAATAYGTLTQTTANGILQIAAQNF
jgi:hypothetical protein